MKKLAIVGIVAIFGFICAIIAYKIGMRHVLNDSKIYLQDQEDGTHILIDIDGNLYEHITD